MTDWGLVTEIREALAKATPGPWKRDRNWYVTGPQHEWDNPSLDQRVAHIIGPRILLNHPEADQELVAHAPEWLAALCGAFERLTAERDAWKARAEKMNEQVGALLGHPPVGGADPR